MRMNDGKQPEYIGSAEQVVDGIEGADCKVELTVKIDFSHIHDVKFDTGVVFLAISIICGEMSQPTICLPMLPSADTRLPVPQAMSSIDSGQNPHSDDM